MKGCVFRSVMMGLLALLGLLTCGLQPVRSSETAKSGIAAVEVESRHVDIWSDGTRLSGDLWYPKGLQSGDYRPP